MFFHFHRRLFRIIREVRGELFLTIQLLHNLSHGFLRTLLFFYTFIHYPLRGHVFYYRERRNYHTRLYALLCSVFRLITLQRATNGHGLSQGFH